MDRQQFNDKRFKIGQSVEISLVQLLSLIVINTSLVSFILNLLFKGQGALEWWSVYIIGVLVFAYLILRIFTSSGLMLGRQVTLLVTVFNLFLNIANYIGIIARWATWQLTILVPAVNLFCMVFLVIVFVIRKKRFKAIILPSFSITIFSLLPIIRLYIRQEDVFVIPAFATIVLALAFGLFANSLVLNWLGLKQSAEKNYEQIKKGVDNFKKAGEKVSAVNRTIDNIGKGAGKIKDFFTSKKKKPMDEEELFNNTTNSNFEQETVIINVADTQKSENGSLKYKVKAFMDIFKKGKINKKSLHTEQETLHTLGMSAIDADIEEESGEIKKKR